jgi:hypothetical protein
MAMLPIVQLAVHQTGMNRHRARRIWDQTVEGVQERNEGRLDSRTFILAALSLQEQLGLDFSVGAYQKARARAIYRTPASA